MLRKRPTDRAWFIPVLLSECEVPARSIGAGETLQDIQWVALHHNWEEGVIRIATAIDPDAEIGHPPYVWQLRDSEWSTLIDAVSDSAFVPILGRGINYRVVPSHEVLGRKWARKLQKPEWMGLSFSEVVEQMVQTQGIDYYDVFHMLKEEYAAARLSELNATGEPHAVLSRLPCRLFITTCIDSFMEDMLTSRGKQPRLVIVDPKDGTSLLRSKFEPTVSEPLVVHVFGHLDHRSYSLAVTVYDHMRLLQSQSNLERFILPWTDMLKRGPCMWLGFDWGTETIEQQALSRILDSLSRALSYSPADRLFDRNFEIRARQEGRQRILLREFMTEFQSRWEREGREQSP